VAAGAVRAHIVPGRCVRAGARKQHGGGESAGVPQKAATTAIRTHSSIAGQQVMCQDRRT
ncbi:MAG TPA: hypothetical protein VJU81_17620, partial [Methylomirabilota bacterium]|nr:hypothetical protein [Methylomirabilota bacterium]